MIATVLCFANLQLDVLCRTVTALPPPGELHMIDAIDFALSGNGGNVAAALGRLGLEVELAGYSGAEIIGEQLRVTLAAMGVGTDKLLRHPTASTGISVITLSPSGERGVIFVNGANALLDLDAVPDTWLHGRRVVSVGSIFALPQFTGEAVGRLFDEAEYLPGTYPFLAAVTHELKPALCEAYSTYLATTNDLADYPSVRLLRQHLADEQEHLRLLTLALNAINPTEEERRLAAEWEESLTSFLAAAGGIDGTTPRTEARPRTASVQPYRISHTLARDTILRRVWDYVIPSQEDVYAHLDYMMGIRLSETNVAEGLVIILFETPGMPWSFYLDISRHCWDEVRHSLFGEAGIEATYADRAALPVRDYEGVFVMEAPALEQYAVLGLEVEGKNMRYPPGKRQEWEFARDAAKHPLMTTFQDFDWADEVLHVNIARRQLDSWFEGGLKAIGEFAKSGKEHRTSVKQRHAPTTLRHSEPPARTKAP